MGKNKRSSYTVLDTRTNQTVEVDSKEEILTYKWLLKALELGIIYSFEYQPKTFTLSDPVKYKDSKGKEKTLFREHVYSPDFLIEFNIMKYHQFKDEFKVMDNGNRIYIDVKGSFNRTSRSFSVDRKWLYQKYGIYIYELQPKEFFKKFGILEEFKLTEKTKKPSKVFEGYPVITDIFK